MRARRLIQVALGALVVPAGLLCFSASALAAPEAPVTREAKLITGTTAVLHGVLNPRAKAPEAVEYSFAYAASGSECAGGLVAPVLPVLAPGDPGEAVSVTLTGLEGSTEYAFCVVSNALGEPSLSGLPLTFKTLAAAPVVDGVSSSGVTPFEATVEAQVNPENQPSTSCVFEYGTSTAYGHSVPCAQPVLEGGGDTGASATLTGLKSASPTTTYHYRVVVKNATGDVKGPDGEFTTLEAVKPAVESESYSGVTPFAATLEAQVNPKYQETSCEFVYGTDPTLTTGTKTVPCEPAAFGTGGGPVGVTLPLSGLTPNTSYYFRVVATNATGKEEGTITEVKTLATVKPEVVSESDANVTPYEVTLLTEVNPEYQETSCEFVYGTSPTLSTGTTTTPCEPAQLGNGGGATGASLTLKGLTPSTPYFFRVIATNATGKIEGAITEVKTLALVKPVVESENAPVLSPFEATLEAAVNPEYQETTCKFEYSTNALFPPGETTTVACPAPLGNGGGGVGTSVPVSGLKSATTYHYRIVATNGTGTTEGPGEFTTLPAEAPAIESESVSFLSSTRATLEATVNPNWQATTYTFEYATEESALLEGNATKIPGGSIPAGFGGQPVHADINGGLSPGTTYYYRVVATNAKGTTSGMVTVAHFKTPVPPQASTGKAQEVTHNTATVSGTVNSEGQETSYTIQYGPTANYGYSTAPVNVGAGTTNIATGAVVLSYLLPDTTYHYRVLAVNSAGESAAGADQTFTTEPGPPTPPSEGEQTPVTPTPIGAAPVGSTFPNLTAIAPLPGPKETAVEAPATETKSLTRAQKLNKALKACRKAKGKQRASCEKQAHRKYGPKPSKGKRGKI
jgi:phosphodiesterase/alkaline phosphatase D-like protein